MAHIHSVFDSNEHFVIDPVSRAITNGLSKKIVVMQFDHNSERFSFEIPKLIDGHKMTACDRVEIHYINIDATDKSLVSTGVYEANDIQDSPDNNSVAVFSWLLSRNATKYAGTLNFLIHFGCTVDGVEEYAWNTAIFQSITIGNGMNNGTTENIEPFLDVLAQWKADLFGVGDTQEQRLLTVSAEQQAAIAAKGAAVLDSIPDEYEALQAQTDENTRIKAGAIVLDAEGESIVVNDASDFPMMGLKVFGKSEQLKTTGKNLFDITKEELLVVGSSGVQRYGYSFDVTGTYTFTCIGDNATSVTCKVVSNGVYGDYKSFVLTANYTVTLGENDVLIIYRAEENVRLSDGIKNAQLEAGSVATEYEPYSGGVASPSPEWSQEINSIENVALMVYGKNLIPPRVVTWEYAGLTFTGNDDGTVSVAGTVNSDEDSTFHVVLKDSPLTLPKGDYLLSGIQDGSEKTYRILIYKTDWTFLTECTDGSKPFSLDQTTDVFVYIWVARGTTINKTFHPMIRLASVEDEAFDTYKKQAFSIPRTLPGIPVASGGNYTDANGQQWICDEVDLARGVYVQRCFKENLSFMYQDGLNRYSATLSNVADADCADGVGIPVLCETLAFDANAGSGMPVINGIRISATSPKYAIACYNDEVIESATLIYPLASPIETALTDAEITAFKALHSNKPNTTILNDAGAFMAVEYVADTKTYIDNKIAELKGSE